MAWYFILFYISLIFFVIKFFITLIAGDIDFDVDFDGDIDFDLSSMFSFKGILHFILGFSSYLSIVAKLNTINDETYIFSTSDYIIGIGIGVIFTIGLFYLYKLMLKLNNYNLNNIDVTNYNCTILIKNGLIDIWNENKHGHSHIYSYTVLVNTEFGSQKLNVVSEKSDLPVGSTHKIRINEQGIYYI